MCVSISNAVISPDKYVNSFSGAYSVNCIWTLYMEKWWLRRNIEIDNQKYDICETIIELSSREKKQQFYEETNIQ